jgi:tetratricopeptide (TPR) repeat protein
VELGDAATAVPLLREAQELVPGDPTATSFLADAYILAGWFDDANDLLDAVIAQGRGRRTPEMAMFYHRKAQVAAAIGDHAQQLAHLQEAHLCNKKNGEIAAELADQAEEMGDWDLAAKTLRTITLIDSDCPITRGEAFLRQGRIAHRQGDEKSAKMWARRAKREEPESEDVDAFLMELGERPSRIR